MLILFFNLRGQAPEEEGHSAASLDLVSLPGFKANPSCYPAHRRLSRAAGKPKRDGLPSIRQQQAEFLHFFWSTCLTRLVGPRHAASISLPPSNPFRPQLFLPEGPSIKLYVN